MVLIELSGRFKAEYHHSNEKIKFEMPEILIKKQLMDKNIV